MSRLARALAVSLALLAAAATAAAAAPGLADGAPAPAKHPIAPEDYARFREVGEPRLSPDGAWVAYTVSTQDLAADRSQKDLWMTSWDGATTLQLTTTEKETESAPRWSPDGRWIAFLSSRGDAREEGQVWRLPLAGGEAVRLTAIHGGVTDLAWSPDGTRLVLAVADSDTVAAGDKERTAPPIVIDRYYFKEDGSGYLTHLRTHLWLFDIATRRTEPLTGGDQDDLHPAWSPDGRTIAFLSKRGPDADRTNSWEVWTVEARAGAEPRALTRFEGRVNDPGGDNELAWSPDGGRIAFLQGGPPGEIYYAPTHLAVVPAAGGDVRVLTGDRWVEDFAWAADGRSLVARADADRATQLVRVSAGGGAPQVLLAGAGTVTAFDLAPNGRTVALYSTPSAPGEVVAVEAGGPRRLTHQNDALLAELELATIEETSFRSRDGTEIHGFLAKPPGYVAGRRYPTLLRIHGGPTSQFVRGWELGSEGLLQVLAARGYVVIEANPRGSTGRGEAFARAIAADWGHRDAEDVLAAVDDAVARGIADPARLGLGGWSYGGMLTNYVIAQDRRFKAATSGASLSNALASYGTDMYVREYEAELGPPWKAPENYLHVSFPFLHADRITTPTLFLCGQNDFNVPLPNSEQMYQALRSLGVETKLVIYPGQTHGLRKPSYKLDRIRRYLEWYDAHLK